MPRKARNYLVRMPYHIVQRGNNREPCFIEPKNYRLYLQLWEDVHEIRQGTQYCHPVGNYRFCRMIGERYGIKLGQKRRGRPLKELG